MKLQLNNAELFQDETIEKKISDLEHKIEIFEDWNNSIIAKSQQKTIWQILTNIVAKTLSIALKVGINIPEKVFDVYIKKAVASARHKHPTYLIGDTHVHSENSDGKYSVEECVKTAQNRGFDFILFLDHLMMKKRRYNFLRSIDEQRKLIEDGIQIKMTPGVEISTIEGHVGCIFPESFYYQKDYSKLTGLRYFRGLKETIQTVKELGGEIIIPHPNAVGHIAPEKKFGVKTQRIKEYINYISAIEKYNTMNPLENNGIPENRFFGSSDSHLKFDIGTCFTAVENKKTLFASLTTGDSHAYAPIFSIKSSQQILFNLLKLYKKIHQ